METKELKIQIPEGYCIDESKSTFEKIVFKKKSTKPKSWEEYCKQHKDTGCCVLGFDISNGYYYRPSIYANGYCTVPSAKLAKAFLAMMQLMSLRQAWIGDWRPDWSKETSHKNPKYCIIPTVFEGFLVVTFYNNFMKMLSFPTREMATDFMNTFKDLLESAKPLI